MILAGSQLCPCDFVMAYLIVSRLCRVKLQLVVSIFFNIILFTVVLKWYLFDGPELGREGAIGPQITKRGITRTSRGTSCYIFVLILTAPVSIERRNAIRQTWLTLPFPKEYSFLYKFVVGTNGLSDEHKKALLNEEEKHRDFLLLDYLKDSYHNLTLKVLQSFVWIADNINAKFVLKVDDDSFVRLGDLVVDLQKKEKFGRIYWGFFRGDANVKTAGPWKEPNWILCDNYLPYANGGGYVLSLDLVSHISKQRNMLQLYNSEDVSVGRSYLFIL